MDRLRASLTTLRARIATWRKSRWAANDNGINLAASVLHVIYRRQKQGKPTRLRQIHKLIGVTQQEALQTIRDMEREGLVRIETVLHDAFESTITLSRKARRRLDRTSQTSETEHSKELP